MNSRYTFFHLFKFAVISLTGKPIPHTWSNSFIIVGTLDCIEQVVWSLAFAILYQYNLSLSHVSELCMLGLPFRACRWMEIEDIIMLNVAIYRRKNVFFAKNKKLKIKKWSLWTTGKKKKKKRIGFWAQRTKIIIIKKVTGLCFRGKKSRVCMHMHYTIISPL